MTPSPQLRQVWVCSVCQTTRLASDTTPEILRTMGWRIAPYVAILCEKCNHE